MKPTQDFRIYLDPEISLIDILLYCFLYHYWKNLPLRVRPKGTGHFFETLSVGSVPGTGHS